MLSSGCHRTRAGARPFFPAAWVPQKGVLDSVVAFGYSPADVAELRAAGAAKAAEIAQFGKVVDFGHSCALYGCSDPAGYHQRVLEYPRVLEARQVRSLRR